MKLWCFIFVLLIYKKFIISSYCFVQSWRKGLRRIGNDREKNQIKMKFLIQKAVTFVLGYESLVFKNVKKLEILKFE
jgi:hypothetical protein